MLEQTCGLCLSPSIQIEGKQKKKDAYLQFLFITRFNLILAFTLIDLISIQQKALISEFPLKLIKINSSGYEQPLILVFYPRSFRKFNVFCTWLHVFVYLKDHDSLAEMFECDFLFDHDCVEFISIFYNLDTCYFNPLSYNMYYNFFNKIKITFCQSWNDFVYEAMFEML